MVGLSLLCSRRCIVSQKYCPINLTATVSMSICDASFNVLILSFSFFYHTPNCDFASIDRDMRTHTEIGPDT